MAFARKLPERPPRILYPVEPGMFRQGTRIEGEVCAVPKGTKARPGKRAPTVAEREWMNAAACHGCIACRMDGQAPRPTAIHHILRGGVRMGHLFTLPLCDPGHHKGGAQFGMVSRHHDKRGFEARYGKEMDLLARLKVELGFFDSYEVTK